MDIDRFWNLIEQARVKAGPAADQAVRDYDNPADDPSVDYWDFSDLDISDLRADAADVLADADAVANDAGSEEDGEEDGDDEIIDPVAIALVEVLTELSPAEIAAFDNLFDAVRDRAERDDLANAAILIEHGFLGDDSFDDFRAGLVALGRTTYELALSDPDSLAQHPLVREIAQANDPRWLGREDMIYAASHAYAEVTGEDEMSFFEFAENFGDEHPPQLDPAEVAEVAMWEVTDEAETQRRLPRLAEMFYSRSMGNRERAMAKLGLREDS